MSIGRRISSRTARTHLMLKLHLQERGGPDLLHPGAIQSKRIARVLARRGIAGINVDRRAVVTRRPGVGIAWRMKAKDSRRGGDRLWPCIGRSQATTEQLQARGSWSGWSCTHDGNHVIPVLGRSMFWGHNRISPSAELFWGA